MTNLEGAVLANIPLKRAMLCLDCEAVYHSLLRACPACGSYAQLVLAKILDRQTKPADSSPAGTCCR